jgi:hypothetical protein
VWQKNLRRGYLERVAEQEGFRTVATHVFDAWSGFESGLSISQRRIKGLPNPTFLMKPVFERLARHCEAREWMGHALVYIGRKPVLAC